MSNADLIERLRKHACYTAFPKPVSEAANALELADKRIAELEAKIDEAYRKGYATGEEEAEHKLEIAMDALKVSAIMPRSHEAHRRAVQVLAQIGGEE